MKKLFAAMFAVCLGFAFFAFAGCAAAPTEEDFTAAQDALDNYTVVVEFEWEDGSAIGDYTSTLLVDGTKGSFETTLVSGVYYAEEAEGGLRLLSPGSSSWQNTSYTSIEQVRAEYNGYVVLFQSLEFGDFTADGDWLVMSEEALANYNEGFTLNSFRVQLQGGRFTTAEAVAEVGGNLLDLTYTFSNYGSTTVTFPA